MSPKPQILLRELNYITPDNKSIIRDLTISFSPKKVAIVGKNGIGKSTLLKLIVGELQPFLGKVNVSGRISYCPQNFMSYLNKTVGEIFGVRKKLAALERIEQGSIDQQDFDVIGDDWDFASQLAESLSLFELYGIECNRLLRSMSGGEMTRLWLAKVFLEKCDFLILDEPTNNLDLKSKRLLYKAISKWDDGLIIVSHDRGLLELMDQIVEMTPLGVKIYRQNYENFEKQKKIEKYAVVEELQASQQLLKKARQIIQVRKERHHKNESKGKNNKKTQIKAIGSYDKLGFKKAKERSEKTNRTILLQAEKKLDVLSLKVKEAKKKIEACNEIKIELPKTYVPSNKIIVRLEKINFSYKKQNKMLINNFDLLIKGPERIALMGNNGSGKTTLIKLIFGDLAPLGGYISVGTSRISYLDQNIDILKNNLTILANYKKINPDIKETNARFYLANFLFRREDVLKKNSTLSGGERLRAALACILTANEPPQLLVLDEPTNHLDLKSISALESALNCYKGSLIVISHDVYFIKKLGISKIIKLYSE